MFILCKLDFIFIECLTLNIFLHFKYKIKCLIIDKKYIQ